MPWRVERNESTLDVHITPPMTGEWEQLMDAIQAQLDPKPVAIHLPSRLSGATKTDADMLKMLWQGLTSKGIPLLPPQDR